MKWEATIPWNKEVRVRSGAVTYCANPIRLPAWLVRVLLLKEGTLKLSHVDKKMRVMVFVKS